MDTPELQRWLQAHLPPPLHAQPPDIHTYDDEIIIILYPTPENQPGDLDPEHLHQTHHQQIAQAREQSRALRMRLARDIQTQTKRPIAWGMRIGESEQLFTTRSIPVMTRLGRAEREILDTLVAAGIAETRSAALAYCVRVFATEHSGWLAEAREAITHVENIRARLKLTQRPGIPQTPPE